MKIFAKRKRKSVDSAAAEKDEKPATPRSVFQSDEAVEDLLKQDPSTWNAKERRMVKRSQERTPETGDEQGQATEEEKSSQPRETEKEEGDSSDEEKVENDVPDTKPDSNGNKVIEKSATQSIEATSEDTKHSIDDDLQKMLDKLSSKLRRKLIRLLERGGNVEDVRKEAVTLLSENDKGGDIADRADDSIPAKKRRKGADWSALPTDERLRREEQRRVQQEATERRVSGEQQGSKHKHPLNSERRRANRRKPKYARKVNKPENEHDTSGFQMRRVEKSHA
jgi:hypothetical protein